MSFIVLMENVGENVFNPIQLHFIVDVFFLSLDVEVNKYALWRVSVCRSVSEITSLLDKFNGKWHQIQFELIPETYTNFH